MNGRTGVVGGIVVFGVFVAVWIFGWPVLGLAVVAWFGYAVVRAIRQTSG